MATARGSILLVATILSILGWSATARSQSCRGWVEWSGSGPSRREGHTMAYDSARGVTVLFGGEDNGTRSGETWEWDGASWNLRASSGPSPRFGHAMVYDSARAVTVLFGGFDGGGTYVDNETWEWDGIA